MATVASGRRSSSAESWVAGRVRTHDGRLLRLETQLQKIASAVCNIEAMMVQSRDACLVWVAQVPQPMPPAPVVIEPVDAHSVGDPAGLPANHDTVEVSLEGDAAVGQPAQQVEQTGPPRKLVPHVSDVSTAVPIDAVDNKVVGVCEHFDIASVASTEAYDPVVVAAAVDAVPVLPPSNDMTTLAATEPFDFERDGSLAEINADDIAASLLDPSWPRSRPVLSCGIPDGGVCDGRVCSHDEGTQTDSTLVNTLVVGPESPQLMDTYALLAGRSIRSLCVPVTGSIVELRGHLAVAERVVDVLRYASVPACPLNPCPMAMRTAPVDAVNHFVERHLELLDADIVVLERLGVPTAPAIVGANCDFSDGEVVGEDMLADGLSEDKNAVSVNSTSSPYAGMSDAAILAAEGCSADTIAWFIATLAQIHSRGKG